MVGGERMAVVKFLTSVKYKKQYFTAHSDVTVDASDVEELVSKYGAIIVSNDTKAKAVKEEPKTEEKAETKEVKAEEKKDEKKSEKKDK